ncbi:hypothetical protein ACWC09_52280 [Streptomyces sp. NPDC001617]
MKDRVLRRRSWPILAGIATIAVWGVYPWGVQAGITHGNYRDLWLVTAVFSAVTALFLRLGTCVAVLRAESLIVINPIGAKEVKYQDIRKVVSGRGASLKIMTVRDELLAPVVFGASLLDYPFGTSESAALDIRERMPRRPRNLADAEPIKKTRVRFCRPADIFLVIAVLAGMVGGTVGLVN